MSRVLPFEVRLMSHPKSVQLVYRVLKSGKPMKMEDIQRKTKLSARTVRNAIKRLKNECMIQQIPDFRDLRSHYYKLISEHN